MEADEVVIYPTDFFFWFFAYIKNFKIDVLIITLQRHMICNQNIIEKRKSSNNSEHTFEK